MTTAKGRGIDLGQLGRGLVRDAAGIWRVSAAQDRPLSYPEDGNDACFRIEDSSFWFAHRNACLTAALRRVPLDGPLLDIGGGNGVVSQALERGRIETVVLEPGPQGASNARSRGLQNVVCATLEDACFEDGSFGAAGLFDVIEHVADDEALLREVHRILRPNAVVAMTVPSYQWMWSAEDELAGHHRRYTLGRLRTVLSRSSFDIRYQTYFFAALTVPVFALRSLPHRLRRRSATAVEHRASRQHVPSSLLRRTMEMLLAPEVRRIAAGASIPFGTSCLVIAARR
jgi:SAM-dependent methyltransferase